VWFDSWHKLTTTGDKLHPPLRKWIAPTHQIWQWYYSPQNGDLHQIDDGAVFHYLPALNYQQTRATKTYTLVWEEPLTPQFEPGAPTLVIGFTDKNVNKFNKGIQLVKGPSLPTDFWDFLDTWGGMWMWEGINENPPTKYDLTWLVDG
jgi:hypothetical protein